jgi:hypothetical protein
MAQNNVALAESLHARQDKMAPEQVNMRDVVGRDASHELERVGPRAPGVMAEQFPTDGLTAKDARDKVMAAKLRLQTPGGPVGYTPFGKLEAKDADFEWYQKKAAAVEAANFQAWFAREFDRMTPADKKRAKELYPEFYAQRKKLLKQQTKNLFELARLKLEGVQDMDDLKTQYMAETGRLDLGPLQTLLHPESLYSFQRNDTRIKYARAKFERGLLSPFRVFGDEAVPTYADNAAYDGLEMRDTNASNYLAANGSLTGDTSAKNRRIAQFGFLSNVNNTQAEGDAQWWKVLQSGP